MYGETIATSHGEIWIRVDQQTGEMCVWWPFQSHAAELAVGVLQGAARFDREAKRWYVAASRRDEVYAELGRL